MSSPLQAPALHLSRLSLVPDAQRLSLPAIVPMPLSQVLGAGRDRRFTLPQFLVDLPAESGGRTAFFDTGAPPRPQRGALPIVFVHGLAGNVTQWIHVAPALASRTRVLGLDLAGHGESAFAPRERPYSVAAYARQVAAFMDAVDVDRAILVGHSLGGMVASETAIHFPERVAHAVLVNPAGFSPVPRWLQSAGHLILRPRVLEPLLPRVWRWILRQVFQETNDRTREFIETCSDTYVLHDIIGIARVMHDLRHDFMERDLAEELSGSGVATSIVFGAEDKLVPPKRIRAVRDQVKFTVFDEIQRCGHMPNIEQPERVIRALHQVLDSSS